MTKGHIPRDFYVEKLRARRMNGFVKVITGIRRCGKCDYTSAGDNQVNDDDKSGMLYEVPATLNDTWGYKPFDQNWKSADKVMSVREQLASLHTNYLLNIGPDPLGRIPAPCAEILRSAAPRLNV